MVSFFNKVFNEMLAEKDNREESERQDVFEAALKRVIRFRDQLRCCVISFSYSSP